MNVNGGLNDFKEQQSMLSQQILHCHRLPSRRSSVAPISGAFTRDYSFKIDPTDQSVFKAKIVDTTPEAMTLHVYGNSDKIAAMLEPSYMRTGELVNFRDLR